MYRVFLIMDVNVWKEYFHWSEFGKILSLSFFQKFNIKLNYIYSDDQCLHSTCLILRNKESAQSFLQELKLMHFQIFNQFQMNEKKVICELKTKPLNKIKRQMPQVRYGRKIYYIIYSVLLHVCIAAQSYAYAVYSANCCNIPFLFMRICFSS